jgi:hypothetical protein
MVHGVGGHDHLSNLLRTYQSFRANLTSVETPIEGEDLIPGWRLAQFEEGATPPVLTLEPREQPMAGTVGKVCLYEVNYSGLAGVVRRSHPLDLTRLFLGLDLAVCAARQRPRAAVSTPFGGDNAKLARCLQRVTGVLTAGTVPIIGLPALLFKNYIGTFIAWFTRFFEDVATFVLDKNGEQLISAHLDRTMAIIEKGFVPGDRLVVAAHSLGSVVVHNYVVRQWTAGKSRIPDTVVTFGSPIGLLTWLWLFLDFEDMDFNRRVDADPYFCWNPVSNGTAARPSIAWINVVNCVDPIATAFPVEAVDLSSTTATVASALNGGTIEHRFFGPARVGSVGASHGEYLNDKTGFLKILLRASALESGTPQDVAGTRVSAPHWSATDSVLRATQWLLFAGAMAGVAGYCALVARVFQNQSAYWCLPIFLWPMLTVGTLAFFQRLMLGGPTKRITSALIREMSWADIIAFPYRLRERLLSSPEADTDVDPMAASPGYLTRLLINAISFAPTLAAMAIPVVGTCWWTGRWPAWRSVGAHLWSSLTLVALVLFMVYVTFCALHELVRMWRRVVRTIA